MASKLFLLSLFLFFLQLYSVNGGGGGDGDNNKYRCIQKLMPCTPYIKSQDHPPAVCCIPLKQAIDKDSDCLCDLFNNQALLKTFNVSMEDALKLPKACGLDANLDKCNNDTGSSTGAPAPSPPASSTRTPPTPTPETPTTTPAPPTPKPETPSTTPTKSSSSNGGLGKIRAVLMLVANGILYLTMSLI